MSTNVQATALAHTGLTRRQPTPYRHDNGRRGRPRCRHTRCRLIRQTGTKDSQKNFNNKRRRYAKQVDDDRLFKRAVKRFNPMHRLAVTSPSVNKNKMFQLANNRYSRTFNKVNDKIFQVKNSRVRIHKRCGLMPNMIMSMPMVLNAGSSKVTFLRLIRVTRQLPMTITITNSNRITSLPQRLNNIMVTRAITVRLLRHNTFRSITIPLKTRTQGMSLHGRITVFHIFQLCQHVTLLNFNSNSHSPIITKITPISKLNNFILNSLHLSANPPRLPSSMRNTGRNDNGRRFNTSTRYLPNQTPLKQEHTTCYNAAKPYPANINQIYHRSYNVILKRKLCIQRKHRVGKHQCTTIIPTISRY